MSNIEIMLEVPDSVSKSDVENIVSTYYYKVLNDDFAEMQSGNDIKHLYFIKGPISHYSNLKKDIDGLDGYTLWPNGSIGSCVLEDY